MDDLCCCSGFEKREIANWVNFSLIIFALGLDFFILYLMELKTGQDLISFSGINRLGDFLYSWKSFVLLQNVCWRRCKITFCFRSYSAVFRQLFVNLKVFVLFLILFLFAGALYGLFVSGALIFSHFKKFKGEFSKQFKQNKTLFILSLFWLYFLLSWDFQTAL